MKKVLLNGVSVLKVEEKEKSTSLFCKKEYNGKNRDGDWVKKDFVFSLLFIGNKKDLPSKMKMKPGTHLNIAGRLSTSTGNDGKERISIFAEDVEYANYSASPMMIVAMDAFVSKVDEKTIGIGVPSPMKDGPTEWFQIVGQVRNREKIKKGQRVNVIGTFIVDEYEGKLYKKIFSDQVSFGSVPRKKDSDGEEKPKEQNKKEKAAVPKQEYTKHEEFPSFTEMDEDIPFF